MFFVGKQDYPQFRTRSSTTSSAHLTRKSGDGNSFAPSQAISERTRSPAVISHGFHPGAAHRIR